MASGADPDKPDRRGRWRLSRLRGPQEGNRNLIVREEECGCIRVRCVKGHSPQQIVEALGLALKDLLCEQHRGQW
jgi:hypothetical protein